MTVIVLLFYSHNKDNKVVFPKSKLHQRVRKYLILVSRGSTWEISAHACVLLVYVFVVPRDIVLCVGEYVEIVIGVFDKSK